jgi:hypothetical protein
VPVVGRIDQSANGLRIDDVELRALRRDPEPVCSRGCGVAVDVREHDVEPSVHQLAGKSEPDPRRPPVTIAVPAIPTLPPRDDGATELRHGR